MGFVDLIKKRLKKRTEKLEKAVSKKRMYVPRGFQVKQRATEALVRKQMSDIEKLKRDLEEIKQKQVVKVAKPKTGKEAEIVSIRERVEALRTGLFPQIIDRLLQRRRPVLKPMPVIAKPAAAAVAAAGATLGEVTAPGVSKIQKIVVERMEVPHAEIEARISKGVELHEISMGGIELPPTMPTEWVETAKAGLTQTYNLIPREPKEGELVFAMAEIKWDEKEKNLVYNVLEPPLSAGEKGTLKVLEERLSERLSVDFTEVGGITSKQEYLRHHIDSILDLFGVKLDPKQKAKLEYYIFRDFIGLERIWPMMHDQDIEDISCDGVGIPIYVFHRDPRYGQLRANVQFETKAELDDFAMKLAQRCGKGISVASPLLDGALPDGSRVQATLGSDIARRGSNFTIRKFTERPLTPIDLLNYGTVDTLTLAYLWMCVEYGKSILVSGATATGKTSFLNALSLFIRPQLKIVSIEDTAELRLPHPNWIPEVSRSGVGEKGYGAVEMFDLLKAALRQRPDFIIVGEVRGVEANVMFQGMATGHPAMGTIHADAVQKVVDRLVTPPISLSPALLENLDIILILVLSKIGGRYVRRVSQLVEVRGVDVQNRRIEPNIVFSWNPTNDTFSSGRPSMILAKIAAFKGVSDESIKGELLRRANVLGWLRKKGIHDFESFANIIARYYTEADVLMAEIAKEPGKEQPLEAGLYFPAEQKPKGGK